MIFIFSSEHQYPRAVAKRLVQLAADAEQDGRPLSLPLLLEIMAWLWVHHEKQLDDFTLRCTPDGGIMARWWRGDEQVASREFRQEERAWTTP